MSRGFVSPPPNSMSPMRKSQVVEDDFHLPTVKVASVVSSVRTQRKAVPTFSTFWTPATVAHLVQSSRIFAERLRSAAYLRMIESCDSLLIAWPKFSSDTRGIPWRNSIGCGSAVTSVVSSVPAHYHMFRIVDTSGTIIAVWNTDLHYYDQFNPIILRDEILTKVDVLVGTYTYFMDDYFHKVTNVVNERDLPLTYWFPHSSDAEFVNASFNEYPINNIIFSGKLGSKWYPLCHWLRKYQQNHPDFMDIYHLSGYYVAENQSDIYAFYLRSYRTSIRTTLIFQYVIAKLFEIPSTGALLAMNCDVKILLAALEMKACEHYVGFDR
ncbi:hypothetical protein PsorP6_000672 [Peronosclerospora sorghi]|uniref:Uncharacterized protein n=1 Tax=Peronosclerospora sorghi TaxID=230839 RepID=A0ACC0WQN1_9STRA|nr:hypothetical protein PsorP6_000672 [Peronosclerospora sorghi]